MLKIVPVWGGGSDFTVAGSTCGRAGLRFRRIIFFAFFSGSVASVVVVVREVSAGFETVSSVEDVEAFPSCVIVSGPDEVEGAVGRCIEVISAIAERELRLGCVFCYAVVDDALFNRPLVCLGDVFEKIRLCNRKS